MNLNLSIVPYIPLLMNFDKDKFLNEVKDCLCTNTESGTLTLYGLSPEKNLSNKNYGLDESATKQWF